MYKKHLLIGLALFFCLTTNAQKPKKRNVYFLKENGREVKLQDSADIIRIIEEPDSGETNFVVREFYPNGKPRLLGKLSSFYPTIDYEGSLVTYRRNGTMQSNVNFQNGKMLGKAFYFFEDRHVAKEIEYLPTVAGKEAFASIDFMPDYKLIFQSDSLGNVRVKDGNGYAKDANFIDGEMFFEEGKYTNGYKDSLWVGHYASGKSSYQEMYEMGKIIWGKNTVGGITYNYNADDGPPQFKGGLKAFYYHIITGLIYPRDAATLNIQGSLLVAFTINKEGVVDDVEVLKSAHPSLDAEAKRILLRSPKWIPAKQRGIPVKVRYSIPINFTLSSSGTRF